MRFCFRPKQSSAELFLLYCDKGLYDFLKLRPNNINKKDRKNPSWIVTLTYVEGFL